MGAWLFLLVCVALGFAIARAFWPAPWRWSAADPLRLAAAPALGLGAASGFYFALRLVLHLPAAAALGAVAACVPLLAGAAWHRAKTAAPDAEPVDRPAPGWLWGIAGTAAALSVATFLMLHAAAPHGEWDAWSIWNLRARFLFRAQEFVSPFSPLLEWSHPDYPLLVPGVIALLWHAGGGESTGVVGTVALLFLFSAVCVPVWAVRALRGAGMAAVCALGILGMSNLVRVSASMYADVPLAAYVAIAGTLLAYAIEKEEVGAGPALLAGLGAGFAAWTKNEGLLFCVTAVLAYGFVNRKVRGAVPVLGGMGLILALVGHFKVRMAPQNDLVNASNLSLLGAKLTDFGRILSTFFAFGEVLLVPAAVAGVWLWLVGKRPGSRLPLVAVALQLAGYFVIYVGTSKDLPWQLSNSLPRLLLHVWPLAVAGICLISGDIFAPAPQPSPRGARSR